MEIDENLKSLKPATNQADTLKSKPLIRKLGTLDCDMVETTPIVFHGRLYRFEYVRPNYYNNKTGTSYFRFIDVESGELTTAFAKDYHLGSAHVQDDTVFVYGVNRVGGDRIQVFWSRDLKTWSSQPALTKQGWGIYNNSVSKGREHYIMAMELGEPPEEVGVRFTNRFAESDDLINWQLTSPECVYSKDRYTACPALRFINDYYYMVYLEANYHYKIFHPTLGDKPAATYESHIVRSQDLVTWQSSPFNPVMRFSEDDKIIANLKLTAEQREHIAEAVNRNNSDIDLCEFKGKTIIYYSWGNQRGTEFLAHAVYDGTLESFLRGFYET